jgi:glycosyltransferase involved in cell wall biosynthesis
MNGANVSVVMPTYNGGMFLREAIASVIAQTAPPCEIVVADDCSQDDTIEIAAAMAAGSSVPLRSIRLSRNSGGPARPLNAAIEAAGGEWIAVLEQDDVMRPDRLERQMAALAAFPETRFTGGRACRVGAPGYTNGFVGCGEDQFLDLIDEKSRKAQPAHFRVSGTTAFRVLLDRQFLLTNSTFLFHKSLWREVGGFDWRAGTCSDIAFALGAAARTDFAIVNASVVMHRLHEASLNHRNPELAINKALLVRLQYARRYPHLASDKWRIIYWRLRTGGMGALWRAGHYRDLAQLAFELGWRRLGRRWQS